MDERFSAMIEDIRSRIVAVVDESERLFLKFADTFPRFVREMQRSLDRSSRGALKLTRGSSADETLRAVIDDSRRVIRAAADRFSEMHERDAALLESLARGIDTLRDLDHFIDRIKEDSLEMELISLNALTAAIKSGGAGKAFSVITEELKRLSSRTIVLTDRLTQDGKEILVRFAAYRREVESLERFQVDVLAGLDERVTDSFATLESIVGDLGSTLTELMERSRGVEAPVRRIMETVQVQDILRQSLDHVRMALDEIETVEAGPDGTAFAARLADLAETMVAEVAANVEDAASRFSEASAEVERVTSEGERARRSLLGEFLGLFGNSDAEGKAVRAFDAVSENLESIAKEVASYMRIKNALTQSGARLSAFVEALESRFKEFDRILNRFRTINVASRIEVSKQSILRSMNDTVLEMSLLTDRIRDDVAQAAAATRGFVDDTKAAIQKYTDASGDEGSRIAFAEDSLRGAFDQLSRIKDAVRTDAVDFVLFTEDFLSLVRSAVQDSRSVDELGTELVAIKEATATLRGEIETEREKTGGAFNGEVHSQRLKEVIDRFTIYAHKRAGAEIGGFKVEHGNALGEITLF